MHTRIGQKELIKIRLKEFIFIYILLLKFNKFNIMKMYV